MRFLVICFFPAFVPPRSGGELRLVNLYREVAKRHDVTLITSTDFGARFETIQHEPNFEEIRFPKDQRWRHAYETLERAGLHGDLSGLAFSLAVSDPECELRTKALALSASADLIIHEFPYSEPIFADRTDLSEIYNSHNFEAGLVEAIVRGPGSDLAVSKVLRLEKNLAQRAKQIFATCHDDGEKFRLIYGVHSEKIRICPNGFDQSELSPISSQRLKRRRPSDRRPRLLFMGSAHPPNVSAARFIVELARAMPECDFLLAGGVVDALGECHHPANVMLISAVSPDNKLVLLSAADVFLNPVTQGSGTSLKTIETVAAGLPLVSTREGARGFELSADQHVAIVPLNRFPQAIKQLLLDSDSVVARGDWLTQYSWAAISDRFVQDLLKPARAKPQPNELVLAFNDYSLATQNSGGQARILNLLANLDCDVLLITFGDSFDAVRLAPGLLQVAVPKSPAHQLYEDAVNAGQANTANDCVASLFVQTNYILSEIVSWALPRVSAVIFEHCYMAPVIDEILEVRPNVPIVYSAHNIESLQKATILQAHPARESLVNLTASLEAELLKRATLVVACTQDDASRFAEFSKGTLVAANGCQISAPEVVSRWRAETKSNRKTVGFLGSSHGPNVAAASFILTELAPVLHDTQFDIVGTVCSALPISPPPNVKLIGVVSEDEKHRLISQWDMALNPLFEGEGSSVKMADYMAHGLPTIATKVGARGYPVVERDLGVVADKGDFANALQSCLSNPQTIRRQGDNARRYAIDVLNWRNITGEYRKRLHGLLRERKARPAHKPPRLLVVTYRYTEPTMGGAEEYLANLIKRCRHRFSRIDLAAIDIKTITNHFHFGARFDIGEGPSCRLSDPFDRSLFFRPDVVADNTVMES